MLKNVINKFRIFAMLSVFVILFSSCDDSTSVIEGNSALKNDIAGNWKIFRTCTELYYAEGQESEFYEIGYKDTTTVTISKLPTNDNVVTINFGTFDIVTEWISSEAFSTPHWVMNHEITVSNAKMKFQTIIEITGINPFKGTWIEKVEDSPRTETKILRKFEITGTKIPNQLAQ